MFLLGELVKKKGAKTSAKSYKAFIYNKYVIINIIINVHFSYKNLRFHRWLIQGRLKKTGNIKWL